MSDRDDAAQERGSHGDDSGSHGGTGADTGGDVSRRSGSTDQRRPPVYGDLLEFLLVAVSRHLAEVGVTEDDHARIREAAIDVARLVDASRRQSTGHAPPGKTQFPETEERPKGWLTLEEDALVPPRRLWLGPADPISHYYRWAWEYLAYLTLLCDLRRESAVLELGCGHGRTARGLLDYLRHPGCYRGLDVDRVRIADAQARLQSGHPHFEFLWADVYNRRYNPNGRAGADSYVLPFADASFDVVYAASLFTHLLPAEILNYFSQCRRVLRRSGTCLFSMFVLDHYRGVGTAISSDYEFPHRLPDHAGVAVHDLRYPDNLIGYETATIESFAVRTGLRLVRVIPGLWSESPGLAVNEQDLVLLRSDD